MSTTQENVKNYYGHVLQSHEDLKTSACCPAGAMTSHHRDILAQIEPEIKDKFYGCGSPIPPLLDDCVCGNAVSTPFSDPSAAGATLSSRSQL